MSLHIAQQFIQKEIRQKMDKVLWIRFESMYLLNSGMPGEKTVQLPMFAPMSMNFTGAWAVAQRASISMQSFSYDPRK